VKNQPLTPYEWKRSRKEVLHMQYTQLLFEVRDSVASITLNRPEILNALNLELARDLMNVAMECSGNRDVRAVVLSGAGSAFCAGGDLKSFAAQGERLPAYVTEVATYLHAAVSYLTRMQAPVIAAVQGSAAGAGMSLACACDLICAGESARFTAAYTRIGLTPDGSLTYFLSRAVGMKRALELTLLNRTLSAEEAYHWGIVTSIAPDDSMLAQAEALAKRLAMGPTLAFGTTKRLLHQGWNESLETQMTYETQAISAMAASSDGQEGIAAFLGKRPAHFEVK
jgi:2-(1,2-epoxy-1,2-dihydrophenyl)acetyl-CoA isomerase